MLCDVHHCRAGTAGLGGTDRPFARHHLRLEIWRERCGEEADAKNAFCRGGGEPVGVLGLWASAHGRDPGAAGINVGERDLYSTPAPDTERNLVDDLFAA